MITKRLLPLMILMVIPALAQSDTDLKEAQRHYKVALAALDDNNLGIASEELTKAANLAPSNALIQYYLARVQSQQNVPGQALEHLTRAMSLGLPKKEADLAEDLLAKLQYQAKKTEVDASRPSPEKLIGLYDGGSTDDEVHKWEDNDRVDGHATRHSFHFSKQTLSLNIVNQSQVTGFTQVDLVHTREFRCLSTRDSHMNHKDTVKRDNQVYYSFVDLSVTSGGTIEGTERDRVSPSRGNYYRMTCGNERPTSPAVSVKVSWAANGTLTFVFADGSYQTYQKTGSIPGVVGEDAAVDATELRPFK